MFDQFSDISKVWLYKADRQLNENDAQVIAEILNDFVPKWATHGTQMYGDWKIVENWFVVLAVDESKVAASGCSIDSSVKVMKEIGQKLNIDFFNRLKVLISENGETKEIHFSELENHPVAKLFNPLVTDLKTLRENWLIPTTEFSFV